MEYHLRNEQMIAHHRNKEDYEIQPDDCLQFAYGDSRYVKMTNQISFSEDVLKLKNLEELNEDLHRADLVALALLSSEMLDALIKHLINPHERIRELSSSAIVLISGTKIGRDKIIECGYVQNIMKLLDDSVENIRRQGYFSLLNMAEFQEGIDHVFANGILNPLIDKLVEETVESLLILDLKLIERVLYCGEAQHQVLKTLSIQRLTSLLKRKNPEVRALACKNLSCISYDSGGKLDIIKQGCVLDICQRMNDDNDEVIKNATMALSSLAQHNECKFEMMATNQLDHIVKLLDHRDEQVKLNCVQLITHLAEHPVGRTVSKQCLPKLKTFQIDPQYEYISEYATQAIDVILWEP